MRLGGFTGLFYEYFLFELGSFLSSRVKRLSADPARPQS
jgi:hypothetical protein